jgi:crotonyl-CoA reductase
MIDPVISRTFKLEHTGEAAYQVHRNLHEGKIGVLCLAQNEGEGVTNNELRARVGEARLRRFRR